MHDSALQTLCTAVQCCPANLSWELPQAAGLADAPSKTSPCLGVERLAAAWTVCLPCAGLGGSGSLAPGLQAVYQTVRRAREPRIIIFSVVVVM